MVRLKIGRYSRPFIFESGYTLLIMANKCCRNETPHIARCFNRAPMVRKLAYTFPGGDPRMRETIASRAILIFWKDPRIWILLSASLDTSSVI